MQLPLSDALAKNPEYRSKVHQYLPFLTSSVFDFIIKSTTFAEMKCQINLEYKKTSDTSWETLEAS